MAGRLESADAQRIVVVAENACTTLVNELLLPLSEGDKAHVLELARSAFDPSTYPRRFVQQREMMNRDLERQGRPPIPIPPDNDATSAAFSVGIENTIRRALSKLADELELIRLRSARDLSAAKEATMAVPDALTGLGTRASFDKAIAAHGSAATDSAPLALVFVDVDRFKSVNDSHGHAKGDEVLKVVAGRLQGVCGGKGDVFRYGGEEIVVLLPNFNLSEALAVAERCRRAIADQPCADLPVTASFGVSTYPGLVQTIEALCESADKAMYDAKNRGRNLVRFYGEPVPQKREEATQPTRKAPEPGGLTESQRAAFRNLHFTHRALVCPNDGADMRTREAHPINQPIVVFVHCPQCGLNFQC